MQKPRTARYLSRNGSWCEEIHELIIHEDHPAFQLAYKFGQHAEPLEKQWRFTFTDQDWSEFILEANGHVLEA